MLVAVEQILGVLNDAGGHAGGLQSGAGVLGVAVLRPGGDERFELVFVLLPCREGGELRVGGGFGVAEGGRGPLPLSVVAAGDDYPAVG